MCLSGTRFRARCLPESCYFVKATCRLVRGTGFFSTESLVLASDISGAENRGQRQSLSSADFFLLLCCFQNKIILDPMTFSEARFRPSLEERLESIISGAALMADSSCTRDDRRERIVAECNAVRQALQDLLSEYMNNVSPGPPALTSRGGSGARSGGSWRACAA